MTRLRFREGDLARVVVADNTDGNPETLGAIVEIELVGPWPAGAVVNMPLAGPHRTREPEDYVIDFRDGTSAFARDYNLAPLDPPVEPASLTRQECVEVGA